MARAAAAAASPAGDGGAQLLSIGQVLARLTPEFPDLSPSKLRFLEERQLIAPQRTPSGYRKFSPADLERLRFILQLQRDHYLPLKVIRGHLDELDAGRVPQLPTGAGTPSIFPAERRLSREELLHEAGATAPLLADAVSASLIAPAEHHGEDALAVLRALAELQRAGIEPRHLRGLRAAVERETALIQSALAPAARRGDSASRARAAELAREISAQLDLVRGSLVRSALARLDG